MERAILKHCKQEHLYLQFRALWYLLQERQHLYYIAHTRSHTGLPGELAAANAGADCLLTPAWVGPVPDKLSQAKRPHEFFHQSANVLMQQFHLHLPDAKSIVQTCPDCQGLSTVSLSAVNPRELHSLQIWQMDVTHVPEF